jgi:hypothetical protein
MSGRDTLIGYVDVLVSVTSFNQFTPMPFISENSDRLWEMTGSW